MSQRPGSPGYSAGWCIHFRDMSRHETCEAGVNYRNLAAGEPKLRTLPCFLDKAKLEPQAGAVACAAFCAPTRDEVAAHEAWVGARFETLGTVMQGIAGWRKANRGRNAAEVVECPACKGRLHLSIAASNGHVHGACETDGCARWME